MNGLEISSSSIADLDVIGLIPSPAEVDTYNVESARETAGVAEATKIYAKESARVDAEEVLSMRAEKALRVHVNAVETSAMSRVASKDFQYWQPNPAGSVGGITFGRTFF
jgi:exoribonuclease II